MDRLSSKRSITIHVGIVGMAMLTITSMEVAPSIYDQINSDVPVANVRAG